MGRGSFTSNTGACCCSVLSPAEVSKILPAIPMCEPGLLAVVQILLATACSSSPLGSCRSSRMYFFSTLQKQYSSDSPLENPELLSLLHHHCFCMLLLLARDVNISGHSGAENELQCVMHEVELGNWKQENCLSLPRYRAAAPPVKDAVPERHSTALGSCCAQGSIPAHPADRPVSACLSFTGLSPQLLLFTRLPLKQGSACFFFGGGT